MKNKPIYAVALSLALTTGATAALAQTTPDGRNPVGAPSNPNPAVPGAVNAASGPLPPAAPRTGTATRTSLSNADSRFMRSAARAGMAEVESSKLALQKSSNQQVKTFAQQMVDDHSKANQELNSLASSKGLRLPTEPSLTQRAKMKLLSSSDGAKFDQRYSENMGVSAHQDTVKLFQKAANSADDAEVKAFASKTLPTLQHHLEMARALPGAKKK